MSIHKIIQMAVMADPTTGIGASLLCVTKGYQVDPTLFSASVDDAVVTCVNCRANLPTPVVSAAETRLTAFKTLSETYQNKQDVFIRAGGDLAGFPDFDPVTSEVLFVLAAVKPLIV